MRSDVNRRVMECRASLLESSKSVIRAAGATVLSSAPATVLEESTGRRVDGYVIVYTWPQVTR